jgi:DNA-binding winged helix-turn-helix (wHTH) protein/Flp pilus assembly protein TadD
VPIYSFGRFQLDSESRRLLRETATIPLSDRHVEVLLQLVTHAGQIVTKDALIDAAWGEVAVTDNSLEQAISVLRRALGDTEPHAFIETVPRRGYRFAAPVSREVRRGTDEELAALLAPHRAWLEGRSLLETLERDQLNAAEAAFKRALEALPDLAAPHVGLANACAFRFEATRLHQVLDVESLRTATQHAREACRLEPGLAEAWATLGFVLSRSGQADDALAASRRAVALEPDNWRHQLRLAFVSWGEERLRASSRTLRLMPGLSLAHFLAATVHVARQSFETAESELEAGIVAQNAQPAGASRFTSVGVHWLRGLLRLRAGDEPQARAAFARELSEGAAHLYGAECGANVHYALGVTAWRSGDLPAALDAFDRALSLAPGHRLVSAVRRVLDANTPAPGAAAPEAASAVVDAAIVASVADVARGDHRAAALRVQAAMVSAPPGHQGWTLPLDPFFDVRSQSDAWAGPLGILRTRAG